MPTCFQKITELAYGLCKQNQVISFTHRHAQNAAIFLLRGSGNQEVLHKKNPKICHFDDIWTALPASQGHIAKAAASLGNFHQFLLVYVYSPSPSFGRFAIRASWVHVVPCQIRLMGPSYPVRVFKQCAVGFPHDIVRRIFGKPKRFKMKTNILPRTQKTAGFKPVA